MTNFTPQNEKRTKRYRIPLGKVKVISGELLRRGLGQKAIVEIKGKQFKVIGISCGLPNCQCDSYLKEIKPIKQ